MKIKEIDSRLEELKNQLEANEGRRAEVYSRIVGYYRSVQNWNKGKKEEFAIRKTYQVKCLPGQISDPAAMEETKPEVPAIIPVEEKKLIQEVVEEPEVKAEAARERNEEPPQVEESASQGDLFSEPKETPELSYRFYFRQDCPNCPPVKALMEEIDLPGDAIDVDQEEGLQKAVDDNVYSAPTVIFVDSSDKELFRGDNTAKLEEYLSTVGEVVTA